MCRYAFMVCGVVCMASIVLASDEVDREFPAFDFRRASEVRRWQERHDLAPPQADQDGMRLPITGDDPYLVGPRVDFPQQVPLTVRLKVYSDEPGSWQLFFFDRHANEAQSVRMAGRAGEWIELKAALPALGPGFRLRIDPPGRKGKCVVAEMRFRRRLTIDPPAWPQPQPTGETVASLVSGDLELRHAARWGDFSLRVAGHPMAAGYNRASIGYVHDGKVEWLNITGSSPVEWKTADKRLRVAFRCDDPHGGTWQGVQEFSVGKRGAIDVETSFQASQDREVVWLPSLLVLPGLHAYGAKKQQALFAGLEYLEDEPSSSTADVEGPAALRRVPNALKITFPLMAISHGDRYVGLEWEMTARAAAIFDSPDRTLRSESHLMGLISPGSDGQNRMDGEPFPSEPMLLQAGELLKTRGAILGGRGASMVPAVQQYCDRHGLPEIPPVPRLDDYVRLAAAGWIDSPLVKEGLFRHAVAGEMFGFQPAADAPWMMQRLAGLTTDNRLAEQLESAAKVAIEKVPPRDWYHAAVGHLRVPLAPLLNGQVLESVDQAAGTARSWLSRFEGDGSIRYQAPNQGLDFGRTQPSREASGLAADAVAKGLAAAVYAGDRVLIEAYLDRLRQLEKFADGVPRGAQTWEVPLHTPDILAAAHMVRAYLLGYELTGDAKFLASAQYWAWTGVPFIYLRSVESGPVGAYATIPVFGATHWTSVVWIGLPVQWCGLVYADAIDQLAVHDPQGPWLRLARGIAASGIQQCYPLDHPHRGLLPDSYDLSVQTRNPADINPGTLELPALRLFQQRPEYTFRAVRNTGLLVHAPGSLRVDRSDADGATIQFTPWREAVNYVLIHGVKAGARLRLNGKATELAAPHEYRATTGTLVLRLEAETIFELSQ